MSQITTSISAVPGEPVVQTLTGNSGGAVPPTAGNINIVGSTGIVVTGNPGTSTLTISGATEAGTFTADSGSATPAAGVIVMKGGSNISTSGATNVVTYNVSGTTNHAVQIGNVGGSLTSLAVGTNGQVLIGSTGADPAFSTLTSTGGTIAFTPGAHTLNLETSGTVNTITGNTGGAISPTAGNINIVGSGAITVTGNPGTSTLTISGATDASSFPTDSGTAVPAAGALTIHGTHGLNTSGAGSTVTVAVNNTLTLGDLSVVGANNPALTITTGDIDIVAGNLVMPTTASASVGVIKFGADPYIQFFNGNTYVGDNAGNFVGTTANTGIGNNALSSNTSGSSNTAVGSGAVLGSLTSGQSNTALGGAALTSLLTGNANIGIGLQTGSAYTGSESNNILIGTAQIGTAAESNVIRLGLTSGGSAHTKAFIGGINGINVGSIANVATVASTGQIGSAVITAGTGITVTPGANTITIAASGTSNFTYTNVNTTPYVVLTTDEYISVDSSGGARTIQLPNAATSGRAYIIKDRTGSAATHNITVTTVGGAVNIDGATTYVMNNNYQAIQIIGNGSTYEIY